MVFKPGQVLTALGTAVRNDNVRRVELAWGAAIAAEWAHFVALGVFAYEHGGTSAVGIAGLVRLLPAAIVAPFAATFGDRFRRALRRYRDDLDALYADPDIIAALRRHQIPLRRRAGTPARRTPSAGGPRPCSASPRDR